MIIYLKTVTALKHTKNFNEKKILDGWIKCGRVVIILPDDNDDDHLQIDAFTKTRSEINKGI